MLLRDGAADVRDDGFRFGSFEPPVNLLDDDDPLLVLDRYRERGPATRAQRRVTALDRVLDVLRVEVATAGDD
jgi:hypothetical protein